MPSLYKIPAITKCSAYIILNLLFHSFEFMQIFDDKSEFLPNKSLI